MKRILSIILLFPLALNAMEGANTNSPDMSDRFQAGSEYTPAIVDNNDVPLPWIGTYWTDLENWIENPTTRMNSIEYSVKKDDESKEVLAQGIALAAFNTVFRRRLNKETLLKITFVNK